MKLKMDLSLEQKGVMKAYSIIFPTLSIMWVHFTMPWIGQYIKIKHDSLYDSHLEINKVWTPITKKKIQLKGNPNHTIAQIQYPI
jgi:hypothetical protein